MNFPDRNHLIQLRKELWQRPRSRAAVMVGAGFSLNARPSPGIDTGFPTWRKLARAMFDEVYPPGDRAIRDREELFNRSNPLRVASEYEAAFKRQKLESFLRAHVPDSGHQPGPMHDLTIATAMARRVHDQLRHTSGTNRSDRTSIPAGDNCCGSYHRDPAAHRQAAWRAALTDAVHHHRGGLPDLSETLRAIRQYRSTVTYREFVRADRLFR